MSWHRTRSRRGEARTADSSSGTRSACRPHAKSASTLSSTTASRSSPSCRMQPERTPRKQNRLGPRPSTSPAPGGTGLLRYGRHHPRAFCGLQRQTDEIGRRRPRQPARRARSRGLSVATTSSGSVRRNLDTRTCKEFLAVPPASAPHRSSTKRSTETTRPGWVANNAKSARSFAPATVTGTPSRRPPRRSRGGYSTYESYIRPG